MARAGTRGGPRWRGRALVGLLTLTLVASLGLPSGAQEDDGEIRVIRDTYGVPHIFADTAEEVAYAAGYVQSQDRMWLMHLLRLISKGESSEVLGSVTLATDRTMHFYTYTEAERTRKFATLPARTQAVMRAYVDGINDWIAEIEADPTLLPQEFTTFGVGLPPAWKVEDSVAVADLLAYALGAAAGSELEYAALLDWLIDAYGEEQGLTMFDDLVPTVDPDAYPTVPDDYDYRNEPTQAREDEVEAGRALPGDARLSLSPEERAPLGPAATTSGGEGARGTFEQLALVPDFDVAMEAYRRLEAGREAVADLYKGGSNVLLVGPSHSSSGNALGTYGPQNGYSFPSLHYDWGLHSQDGFYDVSGMTIPAAGPVVMMGRGDGYFFSATVGFSDSVDTYVVPLGPDPRTYVYAGNVEAMDCRTETYRFHGVQIDSQEICRTRHGPVLAFDEANGVAYVYRTSWFDREIQTFATGFGWQHAESIADFATTSLQMPSPTNQFYIDDQGNYAYWHVFNAPIRPDGVDIRLPQDGSGDGEWVGLVPVSQMPHAVNASRGFISNWNSNVAVDWPDERAFPPAQHHMALHEALDPAHPATDTDGTPLNPDGSFDSDDLNAVLRHGAMRHGVHSQYGRFLPDADDLTSQIAKDALAVVESWDGFLTDPDGDLLYHAGRTILDAWKVDLREAVFRDDFTPAGGSAQFWSTADFVGEGGALWHALAVDDALAYEHDWLNGETPEQVAARAFEATAARLQQQYPLLPPERWQQNIEYMYYQPLGTGATTVPIHLAMDRGTSNAIVQYLDGPDGSGVLGRATADAGSILPPGQNGHVDQTGQPGPHSADQGPLYANWEYKPMPMTLEEVTDVAESETTLSYDGSDGEASAGEGAPSTGGTVDGGGARPAALPATGSRIAVYGTLLAPLGLMLSSRSGAGRRRGSERRAAAAA